MEAIRQVYEDSPDVITITVPEELRHQRVEVIVQPLTAPTVSAELPEVRERTVEELAAEFGLAPEDIRDPGIMKFSGCLPDFPPAIAAAHKLTLVTHNTREFSRIPTLQLEDWEI